MEKENNNEFVFYSDKLNYKTAPGLKGKEYFVEGYISTGDLDLVNDIVTKSCMDSMLSQFDNRSIKMDFEHEAFRGSNPIDSEVAKTRIPLGKAITKSQDSKGVLVKWKMNSNWKKFDQKGNVVMTFKDIWNSVEDGMYDAFSIAYVPTRTKNIDREGKSIRLLDDVNLLNVALTGNAINPAATMTSVMAKSLEFMKSQEKADPVDLTLVEVKDIKDQVDKLNIELSDIKKHMGCTMKDTKDEAPVEEAQTPKTPEAEGKEQKPAVEATPEAAEAPAEAAPVVEAGEEAPAPEEKSEDLAEIKSKMEAMEKSIKDLKKENTDLKAIVEKPQQKSKGAGLKSEQIQEPVDKMNGPLDLV